MSPYRLYGRSALWSSRTLAHKLLLQYYHSDLRSCRRLNYCRSDLRSSRNQTPNNSHSHPDFRPSRNKANSARTCSPIAKNCCRSAVQICSLLTNFLLPAPPFGFSQISCTAVPPFGSAVLSQIHTLPFRTCGSLSKSMTYNTASTSSPPTNN